MSNGRMREREEEAYEHADIGSLEELENKENFEEERKAPKATATEATYNDYLLEKITQMFNKEEKDAFIIASDKKRPITIRANTLKEKRSSLMEKLAHRGVNIEKIEWSTSGAVVYNSDVPIGATPEYLAGYYILQSPSSMLPVMALDPRENEVVVDMCAAPGGKTTHIAMLMKNTGVIFANDLKKERVISLVANIQRMGITNSICTAMNAMNLPYNAVDRVLLDAPCSGTGVISKDPSVKRNKDEASVALLQKVQKELILKAFDMLNPKKPETATLVYSTCSILVEENEEVVDYLLKKRKNARVVETELPIGKQGFYSYRGKHFHPSLRSTRRFYPHLYNTDGFFVAKIRKIGYTPEEQLQRSEDRKKLLKKGTSNKESTKKEISKENMEPIKQESVKKDKKKSNKSGATKKQKTKE
ncbi:25S rRNA (cytosine2870-C5)-methyltransferase [Nematocida sp. LUAm3]|nr:25S rRNA (cytosine2870-C5)-methyltransferase [Nematocida sp. LUAm3]KAI5173779.1 25S rRNA (cytosine2870-C5)-methyltransferase [Nematocida sp. LUAm2]KAI5177002.1 25S rRNA (cytosine2870-C5)-methyltransferase [Nematocida sp. LUAm1]